MSALDSQCAQHCSGERNFADSGEMCYGIVILGMVLALVLAQKRQDNRPQHLIHVGLTDQVFLYNHQICRPRCLTSPGDMANIVHKNPMFDPNIEFLRKME